MARRRTTTTVVEIDHGAVRVESALDLCPVALVVGEGLGWPVAGNGVRAEQRLDRVLAKNRLRGESGSGHAREKFPSGRHPVSDATNERAAVIENDGRSIIWLPSPPGGGGAA